MNMTKEKRNAALASVGLLALSIYVMACNSSPSFSPDDTKVLYPAFDPVTGVIGMSVYDREAGSSEMLFCWRVRPWQSDEHPPCPPSPRPMAAQRQGRRDRLCRPGGNNKEGAITLSVIPWLGASRSRPYCRSATPRKRENCSWPHPSALPANDCSTAVGPISCSVLTFGPSPVPSMNSKTRKATWPSIQRRMVGGVLFGAADRP